MMEGPNILAIGDKLERFIGMHVAGVFCTDGSTGRYDRNSSSMDALLDAEVMDVIVKGNSIFLIFNRHGERLAAISTLGIDGEWVIQSRDCRPGMPALEHVRLSLVFTNKCTGAMVPDLHFVSKRNFGVFKIVTISEMHRKMGELGADIMAPANLWASITVPKFKERLARFGKSLTVKEALLDQRIASGTGPIIVQEALSSWLMAGSRPVSSLSQDEIHEIWESLHYYATKMYKEM